MLSENGDQFAASSGVETSFSTNGTENRVTFAEDVQVAASPDSAANADGDDIDEETTLKNLTTSVRDQDDLERDITYQANLALIDAEDKKDEKRIEKAKTGKLKLENQKKTQQEKLHQARGNPTLKTRIQQEIARIDSEIELIDKDITAFQKYIEQRHQAGPNEDVANSVGNGRLPNETQRDFLIRTGKITPFSKFGGPRPEGVQGDLADAIIDAEDEAVAEELENKQTADQPRSHQNLRMPGFFEEPEPVAVAAESEFGLRPRKKRKVQREASSDYFEPSAASEAATSETTRTEDSDDYDMTELPRTTPSRKQKAAVTVDEKVDFSKIDDGDESQYQKRLSDWVKRRNRARRHKQEQEGLSADNLQDDGEEEWFKPSPDQPDHVFDNGLRLPGDIYPSLFDYQKTGVQWLAELYDQKVGGIVGDEMGLGKTVQLISFVAALHYSKKLTKPVIVVAPATVLQQWVSEFHRWWPALRVSILHSSGSGMMNVKKEVSREKEEFSWDKRDSKPKSSRAAKNIVDRVVENGHVLITTYAGLQTYEDVLIPVEWDYAVLDEGHKIRNPNTAITVYCKELRTPNRVILSGTPMQNNLTELWSLFDFIYPMRLGTLVSFRTTFEIPIKLGQYANASNLDIMTGQKCAETLKDTISPYLLQRIKKDVAADLPRKSEQVLFCKLTKGQRRSYQNFLQSKEMNAILDKSRKSLYGIDILRKICNHPDLLDPTLKKKAGYIWGSAAKSGKMQVVKSLLHTWKRLGHKTLLFCQGRQMLDILEGDINRQEGMKYLRMDGDTAIRDRQPLVDRFNKDPNLHLFLLTTRVGGLGLNLTGANRVIIFDPDWNPSTDMQARERAWRLGQKKEVTIYRLMTAGTIEEKIYQRQIFKQFLTNKVLKDPTQRGALNLSDLHDLFSLGTDEDGATETGLLFKGSEVKTGMKPAPKIAPGSGSGNDQLEDQHAAMLRNLADQGDYGDELQNIDGVAKLEEFQGDEEAPADEEDRIMAGIFSRGCIHEALEHDEIVNGRRVVKADQGMLRQEANRVANLAAGHLRRAAESARNVPIGTVTWTGEVGESGRPRPTNVRRGRGGFNSSSVLAGVANRQSLGAAGSASSSRSATPSAGANGIVGVKEFETMIPRFIKNHGGQCPSKMLVDHFDPYCDNKRSSDNFKNALAKTAVMKQSGSSLRAIWSLRAEYR